MAPLDDREMSDYGLLIELSSAQLSNRETIKILVLSTDLHGSSQIGIEPPNNRNLRVFLRVSFQFMRILIHYLIRLVIQFDSVPGTIFRVKKSRGA